MRLRPVQTVPDDITFDRGVPIKEAALRLGVDQTTVRRMIRRGELTVYRVRAPVPGKPVTRGAPRVLLSSIDDYMHRNRVAPDAGAIAAKTTPRQSRGASASAKAAVAYMASLGIRFRS
jgi:hypothetical protein